MRQDFLEIFEKLNDGEVQEWAIYNLVKNVHLLIQSGHKFAVPNAIRQVYERLLYRCEEENPINYRVQYQDGNKSLLNIWRTTNDYFHENNNFKKTVIIPFINFANSGSHNEGINYATIREQDIIDNISRLIQIVNWYFEKVKKTPKIQLNTKFSIPKSEAIENLKQRIEDLKNRNEELKNELKQLKKDNKSLLDEKDTEANKPKTFDNQEEGSVNLDILEKDVFDVIDMFNKQKVYCTHRTIALFMLGLKINQTDFKNLTEIDTFGKYKNNKFSEFEYDMAINSLLNQEKIFLNGYFYNTEDYSNISNEDLSKEYGAKVIDCNIEITPIDRNVITTLREAITSDMDVEFEYLKSIPNRNKAIATHRHYKPLALLPKENYNEINTIDKNKYLNNEDVYYLKVEDKNNEGKIVNKAFRLDSITDLKIV